MKIKLTVIVRGTPVDVAIDDRLPLYCVVPPALHGISDTTPVDCWELRLADGQLVATEAPISAFYFPPGTRLLLDQPGPVGAKAFPGVGR